jgi:lysophospholipase L1-like esterase
MIKRMIILALCSLFFSALQVSAQKHDQFANFKRYEQANKELPAPTKKEKRVVFLGNSITQGWVKIHPEFFKENGYIGRGIGGQTSYQFLLRFRSDVIDLKPKLVIINAGTNDVAENTGPFDIEKTFGNIASMAELAKANNIKVILTSILPASQFKWNKNITDAAERIEALNKKIKAYAKANKIPYVDYYTPMVTGAERSLNPAYSNDGVHPTLEGYLVMEKIIKPAIDKTL